MPPACSRRYGSARKTILSKEKRLFWRSPRKLLTTGLFSASGRPVETYFLALFLCHSSFLSTARRPRKKNEKKEKEKGNCASSNHKLFF
jgi:hypothetical protein